MGAIEVAELAIAYGETKAVDGVTFEVAEGEFFGILGPNGAGKTTTLEMIEGLRRPDAGEIRVLGEKPWPRNPALLPRMGVQLQASSFFERLTAREQLATFAALYGVGPVKVDEWIERVGLVDKAGTRVENLSGGQMQRLSIACALVHEPDIVFLDEPTAALDPQARRNLWDLLAGLNDSGRTVVLTTHYMDEAEVLCDRVAIMDHGRILAARLAEGAGARARRRDPDHRAARAARTARTPSASTASTRSRRAWTGWCSSTRSPAAVLTELAARDALGGITVQSGTLEDVFLATTGREYRA